LFRSSSNTDGFYTCYILQSSVATQLRCGGMFNNHFTTNFSQNAAEKKFWKLVNFVHILAKIWTKLCGLLFWATLYTILYTFSQSRLHVIFYTQLNTKYSYVQCSSLYTLLNMHNSNIIYTIDDRILRLRFLYTGWPKKVSHKVSSISLSNIDRLSIFFTGAFCGKFVIQWLLNIPPHLNCIATLPCEM